MSSNEDAHPCMQLLDNIRKKMIKIEGFILTPEFLKLHAGIFVDYEKLRQIEKKLDEIIDL